MIEDYVSKVLGHQQKPMSQQLMRELLADLALLVPPVAGRPVLDYGCGTGLLTEMLRLRGYMSTGWDPNRDMIEKASELFPNGWYVTGKWPEQALRGRLFDAVVCSNVLGHIQKPETALLFIRSILAPGGTLVVLNPNRTHTRLRMPIDFLRGYRADPTIHHRWNAQGLRDRVHRAGFRAGFAKRMGYRFLGQHSHILMFCYRD